MKLLAFRKRNQMPGGIRRPLIRQLELDPTTAAEALKGFTRTHLAGALALLDTHVATTAGRYAVGDALSLADLTLIPQLSGASRFGVDLAPFQTLMRVHDACMTRAAQRTRFFLTMKLWLH